jgi:D-alanyl-D-alanine carboxypeptidase/D-alanyl-D-alanine-endopeptidase (penicillin-binding protein 4)
VSQNLYAETVFRTLSLGTGPARVEASRSVVADTLRGWGLAPGQFAVADGSGLSRLNFVSASAITTILRAMARSPELFAPFEATLPIAGRDGTIAGRLKATRAEGNAIAKTGTLRSVRSLSGYVRTADGERLVFAFLVNNFTVPTASVDRVVDQAVERLATWTR